MDFKKLIAGISAAVISISALSFSAVSAGAEVNDFKNLTQNQIVKEMGAGWNVGNQLEATNYNDGSPSETAWQSTKITKELIQAVKAQGFKSIRIPVSYLTKIGEGPDYAIDTAWLNRVQEVVDYCVDEGLYAIINIHGDGYTTVLKGWMMSKPRNSWNETLEYYTDEEQVEIYKKYESCWKQIAEKFKNYDHHLIFESMNEVGDGDPNPTAYEKINTYNQIFVDTVRKTGGNNDKRWLLIPGWYTNIDYTAGDYGFKLPTDTYRDKSIPAKEQRIMISVHYYTPWDFCGEEKSNISTTWGTKTQIKEMQDLFTKCYISFVSKGYPVVIGEWGAVDRTSSDPNNKASRVLFANELCKAARARGMVPVYWDNGWNGNLGFGLFNRATNAVTQPEIISAIKKAFEGEPDKFEIVAPLPKDKALALIYWTKSSKALTTVASGKADASMNGAVSVRYVLDCAPDTKFDQYSSLRITANVAGVETAVKIQGDSTLTGATKCTAEFKLTNPIKTGDSYTFYATTQSWREASDYVYLIRSIELLDKNGKVIKTISKAISKPATPVKTTSKPKATTRNASQVAKDKKAAQKAMKQAKLNTLKVKSNAKKKINVTWKKVKKAKGYQIQVSAKKNFKKVIFKKDLKKTKLTIKNKKIKSKKTYFVRVRAYATYKDKNGKAIKVYSKWNKKLRKVKVK